MNGSLGIGTLFGVPIRAHWTVPLLLALFGYSLGTASLPVWLPGRSPLVYAVAAVAAALLLLASLVVHETAHAVTARRAGGEVRDMTLWALGGVTQLDPPRSARAAFTVAVSGPLASLAVGALALGAGAGCETLLDWSVPAVVLVWLGWANLLLAVFNLLPAAPLDGGRVLQSVVWWRTGDQERSQRVAARGGQVFGGLLVACGALMLGTGVPDGAWIALVGVFILVTASGERRQATLTAALGGKRVSEAMSSPVDTGPDWLTVDRFLDDVASRAEHSALPLLDFDGRPSGVVRLRQLAAVPEGRRGELRARDVAVPVSRVTVARPDERLERVMARMSPTSGLPILAVDDDHLAGIVTEHDISRLVERHKLAHQHSSRR